MLLMIFCGLSLLGSFLYFSLYSGCMQGSEKLFLSIFEGGSGTPGSDVARDAIC